MRLLKILGVLVIIFSSLTIASFLAEKIDSSVKSICALRGILEHTKNMIECYSLPASEILRRVELSLLLDCGCDKNALPSDFSELAKRSVIADSEARELLMAFAKDFGKSYRQDEISRCSLYLERIRSREQKLIKESAKRKKVIFTVAFCSALALIILII